MITAFLGKGGVGKTSIASAYAMICSRHGKTLVVSSDFMPSLCHIFKEGRPNLDVLELSEHEVSERWKARYGKQVTQVLREFVDVEDWVLDHVANSPGVAEEFMISNIVDLEESGAYDYVIWDTAASSSTMHLLLLEREFYQHLDRDVRLYLKLRNRFRLSKALQILEEWKSLADRVWNSMEKVKFHVVTTLDELSFIQAEEIKKEITGMGLNVFSTIYNRCKEQPVAANATHIPELKGSAIEIVEQMENYLFQLFETGVHRRHVQSNLMEYR